MLPILVPENCFVIEESIVVESLLYFWSHKTKIHLLLWQIIPAPTELYYCMVDYPIDIMSRPTSSVIMSPDDIIMVWSPLLTLTTFASWCIKMSCQIFLTGPLKIDFLSVPLVDRVELPKQSCSVVILNDDESKPKIKLSMVSLLKASPKTSSNIPSSWEISLTYFWFWRSWETPYCYWILLLQWKMYLPWLMSLEERWNIHNFFFLYVVQKSTEGRSQCTNCVFLGFDTNSSRALPLHFPM